ncbi:hypothetical protein C1931_15585 [Stenotrophomonas sp. YAU14A_MKIMI4_1]|nr:hypothetical protein C1931_15585 [Stenotrophomonas sp. YAU14A_MKIMI4_1]
MERGMDEIKDHPDGTCRVSFGRLLLLSLLMLLGACGSKERAPPYEANPSPKEAYEVVVTTHDAPEEMFISATSADYEIADEGCLPPIDNFEGVRYGIERYSLPIQLRKVSDATFVGEFYRDGMKPSNYFGRGECSWNLVRISANLRAPSTKSIAYFSISASPAHKEQTRFAAKAFVPLLDDGNVYPASSLSQERFEREVALSDYDRFFSYSISINARTHEQ